MAAASSPSADPARQAVANASADLVARSVNTIRTLAMDAVQQAKSGHPGTPMALAPIAYALWTRVMRYDATDPRWPDRDRFVLSCGHASMLLYAMLHLTSDALSLEDLKRFRQWGSPTAGHPERGHVPGIETTTGPLGQGFANAVGMALAERMSAARYNRAGEEIVDHRTWVLASDGDLMEGVCHEAASIAGHLGLGRLCVFYDDNRITIDGETGLTFSEDVAKRFEAYGWHVLSVGDDATIDDYVAAAEQAQAVADRPTLVICRTHIGYGAPTKQDTPAAHGAPLGEDEVVGAKRYLGWPQDATFLVPDDVLDHMRAMGRRGAGAREAWEGLRAAWTLAHPELAATFERTLAGALPEGWEASLPTFEAGTRMATRKASGVVLNAVAGQLPELVGGSSDLAGSNNTWLRDEGVLEKGRYGGRNLHFGIREHAMGAVMNGLALHGGWRPYGGTFLVFSDYMRPAIRMAAIMQLPVVYVFTHDSIGVGEDGPTHQPIEHLAALRAIPGLRVIRPADGAETAVAWRVALEAPGPTALVLSRQSLPELPRKDQGGPLASAEGLTRGAYRLDDAGEVDVLLLASGSEVSLALAAADLLEEGGLQAGVISFPCWELFAAQPEASRASVLHVSASSALRVGVEAGCSLGWRRWVGDDGVLVTIDHFGASAPGDRLMREFGFTPENVAEVARKGLARVRGRHRHGQP